jgi:transcription elongation factor Elf1
MPGETKLAVCRNCGEEFDVEVQDVQNLAAVDTGKDPIEFECCLKGSFGGPT